MDQDRFDKRQCLATIVKSMACTTQHPHPSGRPSHRHTLPLRPHSTTRLLCRSTLVQNLQQGLACFRVWQGWESARSDASCACMCARGRGNALLKHVTRNLAAGATGLLRGRKVAREMMLFFSAQKIALLTLSNVAERGIGSRGHAWAMGLW